MSREYQPLTQVVKTAASTVGNIITENFESLDNWILESTTAGGTKAIDTTKSYIDAKCMKIQTKPTTPTIGDKTTIGRLVSRIPATKYKLSAYIQADNDANVEMGVYVNDEGDNGKYFALRMCPNVAGVLRYLNSAGAEVSLSPTISLGDASRNFQYYTLEVDVANMLYISGGQNDEVSLISAQTAQHSTSPSSYASRSIEIIFKVTATAAAQSTAWIDAVTLEPIL